jgi:hypothetical protein
LQAAAGTKAPFPPWSRLECAVQNKRSTIKPSIQPPPRSPHALKPQGPAPPSLSSRTLKAKTFVLAA